MATHSSILAWRIPWTEEPGRLQSTGSQRVGHDEAPNRDHSVVFEIASTYCISDSFVDHDGYSISSEGFLPAVVDIMVI